MKEIIGIVIALLLFGVVVLTGVWAYRGVIREIDRLNKQRRQAAEDEARHRKECSDKTFEWWARVSSGGGL